MNQRPVITISREFGSGGREIGRRIANQLGIGFYDRELIEIASRESGMHVSIHEKLDETLANKSLLRQSGSKEIRSLDELFSYQAEAVLIAARDSCVIVGRCADYILRNNPNVIRLFIYADRDMRKRRIVEEYGVEAKDAEAVLRKVDKERAVFYNYHTEHTWGSIAQYDLCINTSIITLDMAAALVCAYVEKRK